MSERVERRLAAILAADVAGYSRLMGADEEGTLRDLKAHRLLSQTYATEKVKEFREPGRRAKFLISAPAFLPRQPSACTGARQMLSHTALITFLAIHLECSLWTLVFFQAQPEFGRAVPDRPV
jgi:hypothetical protein